MSSYSKAGLLQISSTKFSKSACSSRCFPLLTSGGIGFGQENSPLFGFLTVLGLVEWEELDEDDIFFWIQGEWCRGDDGKW